MRLFVLTALTMTAFAANSVLTRAGVDGGHMTPMAFATIRVVAGAATLLVLLRLRGIALPDSSPARGAGILSLALYMIGFSLAYQGLDAGLGALILFGTVQITIFAHASWKGEVPGPRQIAGALFAFAGLALVLAPGPGDQTDLPSAFMMIAAGIGWAVYTIVGRGAGAPLAVTARHFLLCAPLVALAWLISPGPGLVGTGTGMALAVASGAVASGLGYALWYHVLPQMRADTGAVVQLSVPVIAILAGALLLGEAIGAIVVIASGMVLGGIALAVIPYRTRGSSGS